MHFLKKFVLLLTLLSSKALAQNAELIEEDEFDDYYDKSYVYTKGVTLLPGFKVSGVANGVFFVRSAEAAKIQKNIPPNLDKNFVRIENIFRDGVTSEDQINTLSPVEKSVSYNYFDGIGRTMQRIRQKSSPQMFDIVKVLNYDVTTGRIKEDYLPYAAGDQSGAFKSNPQAAITNFYSGSSGIADDDKPYSTYDYEISPLNRVKKVYGAGKLWHDQSTSTFKGAAQQTQVNVAGVVRRWYISPTTGRPESDSYYPGGSLIVSVSTSEENYVTKAYADYRGNTVMVDQSGLITYYVYDAMGSLRYILPPELSKLYPSSVSVAQPDQTLLNVWAFQYKYDVRRRLSQEKGPGPDNDWIYYVYDQWDRLVAKQDGVQRQKSPKEWSFIKYDVINRPIITGIFTTSLSTHQGVIDEVSGLRYEEEDSSPYGYTLTRSFPKTATTISFVELLTITYYDDYSFRSISGWSDNNTAYSPDAGLNVMQPVLGLVTGSKVKILGGNTWLNSVVYYDDKYRELQSIARTHLSNVPDRFVNTYNTVGLVVQTQRKHYNPYAASTVTITEEYNYDHTGRITRNYHKIDSNPKVLVAEYNYNELGELIETNLHSTNDGATFLQSVDYRYNVRGWLTSINNSSLEDDNGITNDDSGDLFGINLSYNQETVTINGTATQKLYDGRITAARWASNNLTDPFKERVYGYSYDTQLRFTEAKYAVKNGSLWNDEVGMYDLATTLYDDNGNIKEMQRYAKVADAREEVDNLTYAYHGNGNQLTAVEDASAYSQFGYPNHTTGLNPELEYDKSGNLTSDLNSEIVSVTYNLLNLPTEIVIDVSPNDRSIEYTYDATDYVIKKTYKKGGVPVRVVDYVHGVQYIDDNLSLIFTSEGRASAYDGSFECEYFIKDHLTNTRLVFGYMHDTDVFKATMEDELADGEEAEGQFLNLDASRVFGHNHTPVSTTTPGPDRSAKVNGYNGGNAVGPAKMLQVKTGNKVNMEVYARYTTPTSSNNIVSTLVTAVTSAFSIQNSGETQQAFQALNSSLPGVSATVLRQTNAPKAYLCYIIFSSNYSNSQFGYVPVEEEASISHQLLALDVTVPFDGHMYIYVANESNISEATAAYFDDFRIIHHKANSVLKVTEVNDYDPYGYLLEGAGYVDESTVVNNYKYQGEFSEYEKWTGWSRFGGRGNYDGRLGRWHSLDPASQFKSLTSYAGMANNPVFHTDPTGEVVPLLAAVGAGLIGGVGNLWSNWDGVTNLSQGLQYFAVGATAGAVSIVNPLAGASILSGGNMAVDLINGRPINPVQAVTDFGYTFVGGRATQKALTGSQQLAAEMLELEARIAAEKAVRTAGQRTIVYKTGQAYRDALAKGESVIDYILEPTVEFVESAAKRGEIVIERSVGAATRGFTRNFWKLTDEGASSIATNKTWGKFYKSASDGTWWTVDKYGHGGSAFKVFRETPKGLEWIRDANKYGDYILGKHKGPTGTFIPWGQLNMIR